MASNASDTGSGTAVIFIPKMSWFSLAPPVLPAKPTCARAPGPNNVVKSTFQFPTTGESASESKAKGLGRLLYPVT